MTAGNFHRSAPLPVPLTNETLRLGQDRLQRLHETSLVPIGLENLAFAFGMSDVLEQGDFLDRLLEPFDGFLVLDLHNLYCQVCNFNVPFDKLLFSYPLDRVKEMHVSGGSWKKSSLGETLRQDTHDDKVPEEISEYLPLALERCPNTEVIVFERLGGTLPESAHQEFQEDFQRLSKTVKELSLVS